MIPPVAYLTLLDIYVVGCLFSIVLMAAEGALVSLPSVTAQTADRIDTVPLPQRPFHSAPSTAPLPQRPFHSTPSISPSTSPPNRRS